MSQVPLDTTLGSVRTGIIVIKGKIQAAEWHYNRGELILNRHAKDVSPDAKEEGWSLELDAKIAVIALLNFSARLSSLEHAVRRYSLILVKYSTHAYRRVASLH